MTLRLAPHDCKQLHPEFDTQFVSTRADRVKPGDIIHDTDHVLKTVVWNLSGDNGGFTVCRWVGFLSQDRGIQQFSFFNEDRVSVVRGQ